MKNILFIYLFIYLGTLIRVTHTTVQLSSINQIEIDQINKKVGIAKKALITGILGQDGSYLAEFLFDKGYQVYGITHQITHAYTSIINQLIKKSNLNKTTFTLMPIDITNSDKICDFIQQTQPDEIYNLAAQSHVGKSFEDPQLTIKINTIGTINILEGIKRAGLTNKTKFYQASTSELYGNSVIEPINEKTIFEPRSPYAISKLGAHLATINYRKSYGIFACNGILFNHESPRRPANFVIQKIVKAVVAIKLGFQEILYLGNLNVQRDWGYAKDYIEAMWLMLQQDKAHDYIIATGKSHSLREIVSLAFKETAIEIEWRGKDLEEIGIDKNTGKIVVATDKRYFRPIDTHHMVGDPRKAQKYLHWSPQTTLQDLIKLMIQAEFEKISH